MHLVIKRILSFRLKCGILVFPLSPSCFKPVSVHHFCFVGGVEGAKDGSAAVS